MVYCKRPFAGPEQVLSYLSNYTHRVAISERRIVGIDAKARTVTFRWRDYADGHAVKLCPLDADEFLRRFRRHLLPRGFTKVRHYGLLANNARRKLVPAARAAIEVGAKQKKPERPAKRTAATDATAMPSCPHCGGTNVRFVALVLPSGRRIQRRPPIAERVREPP